jgi:hypothetical protein
MPTAGRSQYRGAVGTPGLPDAAEPSGWDGSSGWDGTIAETVAHLTRAHRFLEHLGHTIPPPGRLTFVELDDAIRCVSRALISLGADQAGPNPAAPGRLEWIDMASSTRSGCPPQENET